MEEGHFSYVYILRSTSDPSRHYIGFTRELERRLKDHNSGKVPHSAKHRPWKIKTAIAFSEEQRAREFEKYLKTASGRAFARKRL